MENVLFKYFEQRHHEGANKLKKQKFGPVITISRQAGCEATKIARLLTDRLNASTAGSPWKFVDKEILEKSAKELNLTRSKMESFYSGQETSKFIDLFISFSKDHVNDLKIKSKVKDIITSFCQQGHIVLVGRAGAALLREKQNTLNIRLTAPFYWRIEAIMQNKSCSIEDAEEWAIDTDEKRHKLFYTFLEKQPCNLDYLFDATLNRQHFSASDTVDLILELAKKRKIEA